MNCDDCRADCNEVMKSGCIANWEASDKEQKNRIADLEQQLEAAKKETNLWKLRVDEAGDYINDYEEIQAALAAKTEVLEKIKDNFVGRCHICHLTEGQCISTCVVVEIRSIIATAALAPCETCGGSGEVHVCKSCPDGNDADCSICFVHGSGMKPCPECTDKETE